VKRVLRTLLRLTLALNATVQALAPGLASIVDARPAALAAVQQMAPHIEEAGASHALRAHVDTCTLCQLSTRASGERPAIAGPTIAPVAFAPVEDVFPAPRPPEARWSALGRGPPAA
jgi:hypothetical protein